MKYEPHTYQDYATQHIINNEIAQVETNGGGGLFMEMGLGKTVATLTAIDHLMYDSFEVRKVLVIAPKRVADHVWTSEVAKWDHLSHLTVSKVLGNERDRKEALKRTADIYTINVENVHWLVAHLGLGWDFDMLVIDELTKFKSRDAIRFKALRQIRPKIKRVVGLTGTPAPKGLLNLWSQMYLLDRGERLGVTRSEYEVRYFHKNPHNPYAKLEVFREKGEKIGESKYEQKIYNKIGDICISMRAADYLELPDKIINDIPIILEPAARAKYDAFERELVMSLPTGDEITAVNAGVLTGKLLQFANGAVYTEDGSYHEIHDQKLDELEDIIEEADGNPVLVFYNFRHDAERIRKRLAKYKPVDLKGSKDIDAWNRGDIQVMIAHPASAGHGLNLQAGGNTIVFFGLNWSLELYLQAIARLFRQGQLKAVIVHRLICTDTMDERVVEVLEGDETVNNSLMGAVKAIIKKHRPVMEVGNKIFV